MNIVQRIARNTAVLLISQVISYLLAFFYTMYTARYLGPAGFGILSFGLAFTGIFAVFGDLGLQPLTVREVARNKSLAPKYLVNMSLMKIFLVSVTFGLICFTINLLGYSETTIKVVYLLGLYIVLQAYIQMFYSIFQAYERMEYQSLGQILNAFLILSGVLVAIKCGFRVITFAALFPLASMVVLGYNFVVLKGKFFDLFSAWSSQKIKIDWSFWKSTIKEALPFGLTGIFVTIYYWIDTVMLSLMKGNEVVGWYNAAYRIVLVLSVIRGIIHTSIFPIMSVFFKDSKESLKLICEKLFKYGIIIALPIAVVTTMLARRIILLIYGTEYFPSVIALQILVWSNVIIFVNFAHRLFETTNRQNLVAKITMLGAMTNIFLNTLLIPSFSYIGAAIATCITEVIVLFIGLALFLKTEYKFSGLSILRNISKVTIAGVIMGYCIKCFYNLNLIILILISALIYIMLLYLMKIFDDTDIYIVKSLVKGG